MSAPGKSKGGGVLPVSAAATKKTGASSKQGSRVPAPKLRLIVRRLPPGLTETEFWTAIGEEWQVGKGKIEWAAFKDGKLSKDPAKPSRPARAYLKVKDQTLIDLLSTKVKGTTFQDARNTSRDLCLLGPPSLEFAPYNKLPSGRGRHDNRQGTIDQDQEFIDFLQSLTEPISNVAANGEEVDTNQEKVTITPLVQYLKEKKANKAKEAAEKKSAKQREAKEAKEKKSSTVVIKGPSTGSASSSTDKARLNKATQDTVKAIHKSVASMQANKQPAAPAKGEQKPATASSKDASTPTPPAKRERERGSASAAARMLQRDLGLVPRPPKGTRAAATSAASKPANEAASAKSEPNVAQQPAADTSGQKSSNSKSPAAPPTGPRSSRPANTTSTVSPAASASPAASVPATVSTGNRPTKNPPNPSSGAKSAFLKHANASQGVTEELLRKKFEEYGTVVRCEIDKKKGLGYIDFDSTESLRKAMHASPVKVGSGSVVVLENRNVKKLQHGQNAAASGNKKSNGVQSQSQKAASPAANSPVPAATVTVATSIPSQASTAVPSEPTVSAPAGTNPPASPTPSNNTPPTAPRGNRSGGRGGSMRGAPGQRGTFGSGGGGRGGGGSGGGGGGGGRGNFRGGRGGGLGGRGGGKGGGTPTPTDASSSNGAGNGQQPGTGKSGGGGGDDKSKN